MLRRAAFVFGIFAVSISSARAQIDCAPPLPRACSWLKYDKVVFVGKVTTKEDASLRYRFRVTEAFKGVKGSYVDLDEFPLGTHFEVGEDYLVFAGPCPWESDRSQCLTSYPCSRTNLLKYSQAVVEQLRAEKAGNRVASVYGTLWRILQGGVGIGDEVYNIPLANVTVRVQSGKRSFEAKTDAHGVYFFGRLPRGRYQVTAELPPHMELGRIILKGPPPPFELPRRSCFENDLYALPTGRISGWVIGPDGKPLLDADVGLYRLGGYKRGQRGDSSFQSGGQPFQFAALPAGDYILVFTDPQWAGPGTPFPRTFYPNAPSLEAAQPVHLEGGQQILDADIHETEMPRTRPITVRVDWGNKNPSDYLTPFLDVEATDRPGGYAYQTQNGSFRLNLLLNESYTIQATALCKQATGFEFQLKTAPIAVGGSDVSNPQVTLRFDEGGCPAK